VSLGNYITMVSGLPPNSSTTSDCLGLSLYNCVQTVTAESPPTGPVHLGDQLDAAGLSWPATWTWTRASRRTTASTRPTARTDPAPDLYQGNSQNPPGYD